MFKIYTGKTATQESKLSSTIYRKNKYSSPSSSLVQPHYWQQFSIKNNIKIELLGPANISAVESKAD